MKKKFTTEEVVKYIVNKLSEDELLLLEGNERDEKYTFKEQLMFHVKNKYPFSLDGQDIEYFVGKIIGLNQETLRKTKLKPYEIDEFIGKFNILFTDKKPKGKIFKKII